MMTAPERAAYEKWVTARPNRYGTALLNAFLDGYRARNAEHIEACHRGCAECVDERSWGTCTSCGGDTEAVGAHELSRCCGSRVVSTEVERSGAFQMAVAVARTRSAAIVERETAWSES